MERIKRISQRLQTGDFSPSYPIGADGINIDMLSGSTLEEEMHLGSPSMTSFDIDDTTKELTITEEFKKSESQTGGYHVVMTTFGVNDNNETIIIQKLNFVKNDGQSELKKTKTVTFIGTNNTLKIKEVVS